MSSNIFERSPVYFCLNNLLMRGISLATLILNLLCFTVSAQYKNIRLGEGYASGPSVAINPRNPADIVVVSGKDDVYVSRDGGKTWEPRKVTSPHGVHGDPVVVADSKGTFYFFHLGRLVSTGASETDVVICQVSYDNGLTWDGGNVVTPAAVMQQLNPWPAIDSKGNIYLTWTQLEKGTDGECKSVIMLSTSGNGKKWSRPVEIYRGGSCVAGDEMAMGTMPATTDDKKVYVSWSSQGKIFVDRSFDGGSLWLSNDIFATDQPGGWDFKISGHDRSNGLPILISDRSKTERKGLLYMVWSDQRSGADDTDVWFMRSNNFGDYWSTPTKVGNTAKNKHQYMPALTIANSTGIIYILFYDRGEYDDARTDVYLAFSGDAGLNFKTVKVSEKPFIPEEQNAFGNHLHISAHKGIVVPVWTRIDDGKTSTMTTVINQSALPK